MKLFKKIIIIVLVLGAICVAFAVGLTLGAEDTSQNDGRTQYAATSQSEQDSSSQPQGDNNTQKPVIPEGGGYAGSSNHGI